MFNNKVSNVVEDSDININYPRNLDVSYYRYMFNNKVSIVSNLDVDNSGIPKTIIYKLPFRPSTPNNVDLYSLHQGGCGIHSRSNTPPPTRSDTNSPILDTITVTSEKDKNVDVLENKNASDLENTKKSYIRNFES
jgi:hypothetical protein